VQEILDGGPCDRRRPPVAAVVTAQPGHLLPEPTGERFSGNLRFVAGTAGSCGASPAAPECGIMPAMTRGTSAGCAAAHAIAE
jgi:hypothetical protein